MTLSLDAITLGVPEVRAAHEFYASVLAATATGNGRYVNLDMHGTGQLALAGTDELAADADAEPATSGFRGYVLNSVVSQPSEVITMLDAAVRSGAKVLKPAKKMLFAGFAAVYQAPDGAIWKLAAPTRKDTGQGGRPPVPTETIAVLGVDEPDASKAFYAALGMTVDRDYGSKFVDFRLTAGTCRLALMPRKALAKDAGVDDGGSGFRAAVLDCRVESRDEVEALLAAAVSAGGRIAVAAGETQWGDYAGHFTDPDGFLWKVACA
ncbi:MAG TPA: VOC family protein [Euzebyales bacterium]|nr:VOC family protein [Euzebyales bacterium]